MAGFYKPYSNDVHSDDNPDFTDQNRRTETLLEEHIEDGDNELGSLTEVEDDSIMVPSTSFMTSLEGRGYTIIELASRYIKTFAFIEKNYGLVFSDEWPYDDFSQAIDALYELFDRVFKVATENMHPEHLMRICIEHQVLQTPIVAPLMPISQMTANIVIDSVERVLQSDKCITFDNTLKITIALVDMPKGGARLHITDLEIAGSIRLKKSLIEITAKDNMCLARAIVIGMAALKDKALYEKLRRDNSRLQRVKATELLISLNLNISEKQTILSIPKFEQYLNIQIIVISGNHLNEIVYKDSDNVDKIFLYLFREHFHLIRSLTGFLLVVIIACCVLKPIITDEIIRVGYAARHLISPLSKYT
ncbi:hypothetical protein GQR58_015995 [Nymphon striatum]|nr:hypothetical protein GQR58_015995 [Nymphon striatum]